MMSVNLSNLNAESSACEEWSQEEEFTGYFSTIRKSKNLSRVRHIKVS